MRNDLQLPALVLRNSALNANITAMSVWCRLNGFDIAPHGKTTMCPQIFRRQLEAGAWGITVATTAQAQVAAEAGIQRIFIANQVVGTANVRALSELKAAEIYCLVDSVESVHQLAAATRPLNVLVEIGKTGWRTGVRSPEAIDPIVKSLPSHLTLRGVEAFEGMAKDAAEADAFLATVVDAAQGLLARTNIDQPIFSVGGSSYLGPVARAFRSLGAPWKRLLRSGCYVTHDHGIYAQQQFAALAVDPTLPHFTPALELWACVQSLPDPGRAIIAFGKRNCAYDISLPVPLDVRGTITAVNDQHAYLSSSDETRLAVGDVLRFGISHPCTAFDKWREIPLIDNDGRVLDLYPTYF